MADRYDDGRSDENDENAFSRGGSSDEMSGVDDVYNKHYDNHHHRHAEGSGMSSHDGSVHEYFDDDCGIDNDLENSDVSTPHINASTSASLSIGEAILKDIKTSHISAEQRSRRGPSGKTTECCVCGARALYTCPGCGRRTCSMTCVRVHKNDFRCSGERDIAAKIPLSEFSDEQLERDFHFLEDCRRVVDNVERNFPRSTWRFTYKALPPPLHALREAARRRGVICQITSEGMRKRDANTSRFDRKTNTIVWRCEFQFVDARQPDGAATASVTIATNWGSERHRLGDVMKYCWATNPPLLCYHINRQYNRASQYVGSASAAKEAAEGRETECSAAQESTKDADSEPSVTHRDANPPDDGDVADTVATSPHSETGNGSAAVAAVEDDEAQKHEEAEASSLLSDPPQTPLLVPLRAYEEAPPMPSIEPVTPEEAEQRAYLNGFLEHERYVILSKAERLGSETKYFRLLPHETLNENLRHLFFVNEFPVFIVVHVSLLGRFPLVTEEDKERIRDSFRSRKTHEPREKAPPRRRSDISPEELQRLAKVPCRRFLHSRCQLKDECPYWHCTPEEIPVCRSFLRTGHCDKGVRCSFRHDPDAVRLARKRQRDEGGRGGGFRGGRGEFRGSRRRR